jgi:hypothetical protein
MVSQGWWALHLDSLFVCFALLRTETSVRLTGFVSFSHPHMAAAANRKLWLVVVLLLAQLGATGAQHPQISTKNGTIVLEIAGGELFGA